MEIIRQTAVAIATELNDATGTLAKGSNTN